MATIFSAGTSGNWIIAKISPVLGAGLTSAPFLSVEHADAVPEALPQTSWQLVGVASYVRYVERMEKTALVAMQAGLGRSEATSGALIPIKKSASWWELPQDERRAIFEDKSRHIANSMKYLPAIARQLYHSRDLGEPFDFLTWFEFSPEHADAFEELVHVLRRTEEWTYVEREVDIRISKAV